MVRMFLILVFGLLPAGVCVCHAGDGRGNSFPLSCPADAEHPAHIAGCPAVTPITGDFSAKPATGPAPAMPAVMSPSASPRETLSQSPDLPIVPLGTSRHPLYLTLRTLLI